MLFHLVVIKIRNMASGWYVPSKPPGVVVGICFPETKEHVWAGCLTRGALGGFPQSLGIMPFFNYVAYGNSRTTAGWNVLDAPNGDAKYHPADTTSMGFQSGMMGMFFGDPTPKNGRTASQRCSGWLLYNLALVDSRYSEHGVKAQKTDEQCSKALLVSVWDQTELKWIEYIGDYQNPGIPIH